MMTVKSGRKGLARELLFKARNAGEQNFVNRLQRWRDKGMPGNMMSTYAFAVPDEMADFFWSIKGMLQDTRTHTNHPWGRL